MYVENTIYYSMKERFVELNIWGKNFFLDTEQNLLTKLEKR